MYLESSSSNLMNSNNEPLSPKSNSFPKLCGECVSTSVRVSEGKVFLTNYRLILNFAGGTFYIPLGVIEQTEVRKVLCLQILCKDARSYKCTYSSSEQCLEWQKLIHDSITVPENIKKIFCHTFCQATQVEKPDLYGFFTNHDVGSSYSAQSDKIFDSEVKRLGFDQGTAWRISSANEQYQLCPSYPRKIIVPATVADCTLEGAARFRSSQRIPTVVWKHQNGAVIARSSQPEVGWLWWRSSEDEDLVKALTEASASHTYSYPGKCSPQKLLIMDARSYATAVANRARGGGCECLEYYPMCEIQFMNLDNIHTIRKSHHALRNIVSLPPDIPNWLSLLESTRWFYHMSGLIRAAVTIAKTIASEGRSVLVHCSDGWDRTPQIIALAEILLDPYYRTFEGFQVLVEREWVEFGHKFSDRCGCGIGSEDVNERCPVFLQWMDCVYQILLQYPTVFQFNQAYLVKLVQHVYSNIFSTFLFNSSQERYTWEMQHSQTTLFSIWPLFRMAQCRYTNYLYAHTTQVLYPSFHTKDLVLWKAVYLNQVEENPEEDSLSNEKISLNVKATESDLMKAKSCENLSLSSCEDYQLSRTSSDPNIRGSSPDLEMLMSALGSTEVEEKPNSLSRSNRSFDNETKPNFTTKDKKVKPICENPLEPLTKRVTPCQFSTSKMTEKDGSVSNRCGDRTFQRLKRDTVKRLTEYPNDSVMSNGVPSFDKADKHLPGASKPVSLADGLYANLTLSKHISSDLSKRCPDDYKKLKKCSQCINLQLQERVLEDSLSLHSSVSGCTYCCKSRKNTVESTEGASWKLFTEELLQTKTEGRNGQRTLHHMAAGHTTPSSSMPSTPKDESFRYMSLHADRPSFYDGLANYTDDITQRLNQMVLQHQFEVDTLKRELVATKSLCHRLIHSRLNRANSENHTEEQDSCSESPGSGSDNSVDPESLGLSDASWEALEEEEKTTLWVPDHAVDACMGCHSQFWIGRRKHHCRNCGKIFCAECSENSVPIPRENLFTPVRVCGTCFSTLLEFRPKFVQVSSN